MRRFRFVHCLAFLLSLWCVLAPSALPQTPPTPTPTKSPRERAIGTIGSTVEQVLPSLRQRVPFKETELVPDLAQLTVSQARRLLESRRLQFAFAAQVSAQTEDAIVLKQSPIANTRVARGSTVQVYTRPPATPQTSLIQVPNVVGASLERARLVLSYAGLLAEPVGPEAQNLAAIVTNQKPEAGSTVAPRTTVTLNLQTPTPTPAVDVAVPMVIGMTLNDARILLRSYNLRWTIANSPTTGPPITGSDKVSGQQPAAGTRVPPGTSIRLIPAIRPASPTPTPEQPITVRVPAVIGLTLPTARKVLGSYQLQSTVRNAQAARNTALVSQQSPAAGALVALDSTVTLLVEPAPVTPTPVTPTPDTTASPPAELVTVPDLVNQDLPTAVKLLQQSRLSLGELLPIESSVVFDTVLQQTPQAGTQVGPGSGVILVVARPLTSAPVAPTVPPTPTPTPAPEDGGWWDQITSLPGFIGLSLLALAGAWLVKKLRGSPLTPTPIPPAAQPQVAPTPIAGLRFVPTLDQGDPTLSVNRSFSLRWELRLLPHADLGEQTLHAPPTGLVTAERKSHDE